MDINVVAVDRKREASWQQLTMTHLFCLVFEEYASVYLDKCGPPRSGDETRALAKAAYEEATQGAYASHLFQTIVAQRPKSW